MDFHRSEYVKVDVHFLQQQLASYKLRCSVLEAELDILKEKNRTENCEADYIKYIALFKLTKNEAKIFGTMMQKNQIDKVRFMATLYPDPDRSPQTKIIDVWICKMRQKLKKYKIEIGTAHGIGYYLSNDNKNKVKLLLQNSEKE